jgi:hypothetical protein
MTFPELTEKRKECLRLLIDGVKDGSINSGATVEIRVLPGQDNPILATRALWHGVRPIETQHTLNKLKLDDLEVFEQLGIVGELGRYHYQINPDRILSLDR